MWSPAKCEPTLEISPSAILTVDHSVIEADADTARLLAEQEAAMAELPSVGTAVQSADGMEFVVDGYYRAGSLHHLNRRIAEIERAGALSAGSRLSEEAIVRSLRDLPRQCAGEDLFPVLIPRTISDRLWALIDDTHLCMPLAFLILDTCPALPGREIWSYQHSIDYLSGDRFAALHTHASDLYEAILAHEIGHAYVHFVLGVDDLRVYRNIADRGP
jgi:hypothetical protein